MLLDTRILYIDVCSSNIQGQLLAWSSVLVSGHRRICDQNRNITLNSHCLAYFKTLNRWQKAGECRALCAVPYMYLRKYHHITEPTRD